MEFFEVSGYWIVALGQTIVHSIWIGLLILSLLKITRFALPDQSPKIRYYLSLFSLFLFLGSVVTTFFLIYNPVLPDAGSTITTYNINRIIQQAGDDAGLNKGSRLVRLCTICSYLYFSGVVVVLGHTLFSMHLAHGLKKESVPMSSEWWIRFIKIKQRLGIRRKIELRESKRLNVPALFGLFKPAIIVPAGMLMHLSTDQVETIILHELCHLRRLDFLMNLIQLVIEGLFFYNPAVWAISKMIRTEREKCCDDLVIQSDIDPVTYARALFKLAEHHHTFNALVPSALGSNQHQLSNRIRRILNPTTMKIHIREKLFSILLLTAGLVMLITVSGFSSGISITKHNDSKQVIESKLVTFADQPKVISAEVQDTIPAKKPGSGEGETLSPEEREEIEREIQAARAEIEDIDWEKIKKEVETARIEAMESIDWKEIEKEIQAARVEIEDIDWEKIKEEMVHTKINMDSLLKDFDFDVDLDIQMDEIRIEAQQAMKEIKDIDWDDLKIEMGKVIIHMDSVMQDFDFDMDFHFEHDMDHEEEIEHDNDYSDGGD